LAIPAIVLAILGKPGAMTSAFYAALALVFAGEIVRCWAVGYSGVTTRGDTVTAPMLVSAGPYAYVRNPLYVGNFITALGFALAFTGGNEGAIRLLLLAFCLGAMLAVYAAIIPHEEAYLRRTFGEAFTAYTRNVPAVFPRFTPWEGRRGAYDPSVILKAETRTFLTFGAMLIVLVLKALLPIMRGG
jgi:protein-S-isoprenylcysteine O-methyltransferase Ste14